MEEIKCIDEISELRNVRLKLLKVISESKSFNYRRILPFLADCGENQVGGFIGVDLLQETAVVHGRAGNIKQCLFVYLYQLQSVLCAIE